MFNTVVAGMVLMSRRRMELELFPSWFRKLWKFWQLRSLVFLSLTAQIVLIFFGNRRRYSPGAGIKFSVWFFYLFADAVATIALGILSNDLGDMYDDGDKLGPDDELTAFWAPFFLLHLGGPDTITAYSIEDNELYLRHVFGLVVQSLVTIYVILMGWVGSRLSFIGIPMIVAGFIKYLERTVALWLASRDKLRDSMLPPPESGPDYPKFMDEFSLKRAEGYLVEATKIEEGGQVESFEDPDAENLIRAKSLFQKFKRLFADLILSYEERNKSRDVFEKLDSINAFDVIAIELGFMYDLLYTKAAVIYTVWGLLSRAATICLTVVVLVLFSFEELRSYDKRNVIITFLLLGVAILLELYALLVILFSDQMRCWLIEPQKRVSKLLKESNFRLFKLLRLISEWLQNTNCWLVKFLRTGIKKVIDLYVSCLKIHRWSGKIAQYNLLSISLNEIHGSRFLPCCFRERREIRRNRKYIKKHASELQHLVFEFVKRKQERLKEHERQKKQDSASFLRELCAERGTYVLKEKLKDHTKVVHMDRFCHWVQKIEFDHSIIVWHLATELCYYRDQLSSRQEKNSSSGGQNGDEKTGNPNAQKDQMAVVKEKAKMARYISRYLMYLLVMYPYMLPVGIGLIRYRDTREETGKILKERMSIFFNGETNSKTNINPRKSLGERFVSMFCGRKEQRKEACKQRTQTRIQGCQILGKIKTYVTPNNVKGDRSKSALFDACVLVSELDGIKDLGVKWEIVRDVWLEMLTYAANKCRGSIHAQQLPKGGEFLTHVWLLMAHFGITEQFQISQGHAKAKLTVK